jgi:hypothetical protein
VTWYRERMNVLPALLAELGRLGRTGSVVLVAVGALLVAFAAATIAGLVQFQIGGFLWGQDMFIVAVPLGFAGLVLIGLGGNVLFGAQAQVDRAASDLKPTRQPLPLADPRAAARVEPVPFWICSDCKVVAPGLSGCCVRCGKTVAFVQVRHEEERRTAVAALSA